MFGSPANHTLRWGAGIEEIDIKITFGNLAIAASTFACALSFSGSDPETMSASGPKPTWLRLDRMSAFRGRADLVQAGLNVGS